ncbi:MAG TPA: heavy metal-binding domain-containing protein [Actinomycetota bacterium]|nr:heavy metal-binding domain-containing protein [Actinomycetota bacterium]
MPSRRNPARHPGSTPASPKRRPPQRSEAGNFESSSGWWPPEGYCCPMHPHVKRTSPGHCPNCEMALVREAPTTPANGVADPVDLLEPDDGEAGGEGP